MRSQNELTMLRWCAIGIGILAMLAFPLLACAGEPVNRTSALYVPEFSQIATFVFVMLGPIKVLVPFVAMTPYMKISDRRKLALFAAMMSLLALALAATIGVSTLHGWSVSPVALQLALGIIIFLTALNPILRQIAPAPTAEPAQADAAKLAGAPSMRAAVIQLVFPTIVPPQGVALVILVLAIDPTLTASMVAAVGLVMVINLAVMLLAQRILSMPGVGLALIMFGNVLGVLQVALGVQIVISTLRVLGALAPLG